MTVLPVAVPVDHQLQCVVVDNAVEEESSSSDPPWCLTSKWLPHHYANTSLLSYATQWRNQQQPQLQMKDHVNPKKRKVASTRPITVFGLAFGDSGDHVNGSDDSNQRPGPYLIACTSHGEIVVWDMYHYHSSITKDEATRRNGPTSFRQFTTPWSLIGHEDDNCDDNHQDQDDDPSKKGGLEFAAPGRTNNTNTSMRNEENQRNRPMLRLRLQYSDKNNKNENDIVLYHCHMTTIQNHSYYVVCGDHGVSILDWHQDILPLLLTKRPTDNNATTVTTRIVPFRHYRTYPTMLVHNYHNNRTRWRGGHGVTKSTKTTPTYYAEVNHTIIVAANDGRRFLYGAANDTFGCYKWNFETGQIVATYTTTPNSSFVSHVNHAYYTLTLFHNHTQTELLLGGEDGQLQIWDSEMDQYLDAVNVNDVVIVTTKGISVSSNSNNNISNHGIHNKDQNRARSSTTGSTAINGSFSATPPQQWYISACTVWNEQWWIIGGGCHNCNSSPLPSYCGFIAIIHGTTRSVLSFITTRYKVQHLSLYTDNSATSSDRSNSSEDQSLMALTNTNYVYRWTNPLALTDAAASQKVWCHTPSAHAMTITTIDPTISMIAVGGVGSEIDVYLGDTQPYMKLSTNF